MSSETVPKAPYLIVRNGQFYFDMRVPVDVVGAYKVRFKRKTGAVRVSLRTKDRKQAQRLAAKHLDHYEELFAELRRAGDAELVLANKVGRRDLSKLSRPELERLVAGYFRDVMRPAAVSPPVDYEDHAELLDEWSETLARVSNRRDVQGNERVQSTADHILLSAGWPQTSSMIGSVERKLVDVDRAADQYRSLIDLVRSASIEGSRLALAELNGTPFTSNDPLFATGFNLAEANDKLGPLLSEALAAWKEGSGVRGSRKPRELTAMEAASAVKRFTELHGDIRIGEITKKRVQEFAAAIVALPAHLPKKFAELTLPELLREDLSEFRQRAAGTINKTFQLLAAIVEDARKRSAYEEAISWPNYFPSARVEEDDSEDRDRDPFSPDDLKRIYVDGPVHGDGQRFRGGQGEAQFWLPLLALLTGARLSELAQLRACDVQSDAGGVAFLDISTSGGRSVKTKSSIRKLPLHPELLRLGFLAFVDRLRSSSTAEARLWPTVKLNGDGRAAAFSKWFNNYLRRAPIQITDKRKVVHCFRHLFKDMCRNAGIPEDVHDALTGHAAGTSVGRSYGAGHAVERLYAEISKMKVPVDLSHLHTARVRKAPPGYVARRQG